MAKKKGNKKAKKRQRKTKKLLQRFAWDVTVGATAGFITYLLTKLF